MTSRRRLVEADFAPEGALAAQSGIRRLGWIVSVLVVSFLGGFLYWASVAALDEGTRGDGRVIPSQRVQVIQNLEGGIVSEILVREGQIVIRPMMMMSLTFDHRLIDGALAGRFRARVRDLLEQPALMAATLR